MWVFAVFSVITCCTNQNDSTEIQLYKLCLPERLKVALQLTAPVSLSLFLFFLQDIFLKKATLEK